MTLTETLVGVAILSLVYGPPLWWAAHSEHYRRNVGAITLKAGGLALAFVAVGPFVFAWGFNELIDGLRWVVGR